MSRIGPPADQPVALRIVRGNPSAEETAAIVALLAGVRPAPAEVPAMQPIFSRWAAPDLMLRQPLSRAGWWASGLPR